ncbi:hypothetical protein [Leptolyngbya sp. FACHB-16]|uniref:hypothetical protein n=1 Tax=unclassified Leptolyngbya TaxID=2650499 RepID=UPI0018EFCACD
MKSQGIQRVCCLLDEDQLVRYPDLLGCYRQAFGTENICWAAIADFEICDRITFQHTILPFLLTSDQCQQRTVVHCSGGLDERDRSLLHGWCSDEVYLSKQRFRQFDGQAEIGGVLDMGMRIKKNRMA